MNILPTIVLVFLYGSVAALAASIIGCIAQSIQSGNYQITTIIANIVAFNAPSYPPNGVGSIFCFVMYFIIGALIYCATLLSNPFNMVFLGLIGVQALTLLAWPRLSYKSQSTITQTSLNLLDPIGTLNFFVSSLGNFTKLFNFSNWKASYLPFLLPYLTMLGSLMVSVGALVMLSQDMNIALVIIALLQILLSRCMINILLDNDLSTPPA